MEVSNYADANHIYGNIYLGSIVAANNLEWLRQHNIQYIIGLVDYQQKYEGITYLLYSNINDIPSEDLNSIFSDCFSFIETSLSSGSNILIHCHAGISRSSTVVIAYLMTKYGFSLFEAFNIVKSIRNVVLPNYGFMCQLQLLDKFSVKYRKYLFL